MSASIHVGNVLDILPTLEAASVNCVVTSPPYWGLRSYLPADDPMKSAELGCEPTPDEYVANMVAVFREVRRVLRDDGTLWLNLGDSYAGSWGNQGRKPERGTQRPIYGEMLTPVLDGRYPAKESNTGACPPGLKPKDLCMIPARVALALQADGWYLRSDIIWSKPNPMPESVTDRPTKAHEYVFLLTKSGRYWYDGDAVREAYHPASLSRYAYQFQGSTSPGRRQPGSRDERYKEHRDGDQNALGRNRRTVWTIATQPYPEAHFATYPEKLVEPCVMAGCPAQVCSECGAPWERVTETTRSFESGSGKAGHLPNGKNGPLLQGGGATMDIRRGPVAHVETLGWQPTCTCAAETTPGTVLDPFTGSGTTGAVACRLGRNFVGIELSPEYAEMAERRIAPHRDQMQLAVTT